MPSSTSSSEPRRARGFPADWLLALLLLVLAEKGLHVLDRGGRLPRTKEWDALVHLRAIDERLRSRPDARTLVVGSSLAARLPLDRMEDRLAPGGLAPVVAITHLGANTRAVLAEVEEIADRRLRPRAIVYPLDSQSVNEHGLRRREEGLVLANLALMASDRPRIALVWWLLDHVALYRHQFFLRQVLVRPWTWPAPPPAPLPGPHRPWTTSMSHYNFDAERDLEFGPLARRELDRLGRYCRERGILLLLVNMPVSREHGGFYGPEGWARYEERYRRHLPEVARRIGAALLDLHDFSYAHEDFTDSHHLAPPAAGRVADRISAELLRLATR